MKDGFVQRADRFAPVLHLSSPVSAADAAPLYQVGDTIMHPSEGVCTVTAIKPMPFRGVEQPYYVLKPALEKSSSTVYLPVSRGNAILRRLLSEADIRALIRRSGECGDVWIDDSKQRKEAFSRILTEGDYARIIRMMTEIRAHSAQREAEGKRPCAADEAILAEAERLLHQEFSQVLHLSAAETAAYIARKLSAQ